MEVTKTFASIVGLPHKVDLTDPELVIIVEICQVRKRLIKHLTS